MRDSTNSQKRYYLNKKMEDIAHTGSINLDPTSIRSLRMLANDKKNIGLNTSNSRTKYLQNIRNSYRNVPNEYESIYAHERTNSNAPLRPAHLHRKNCYSRDLTNIRNSPFYEYNYDRARTDLNRKKHNKVIPKLSVNRNIFLSNDKYHDYIINDYNNLYHDNPNLNYINSSNRMDNYNKSCDYKKERNSQKSNNKGKKMPVIVVSKKNKYKSSAYNYFHKKHQIIKIQSAWRGYFLRKIAVGSIKKYIGFIALIKYLDKIYYNNIQYLFEELIYFFKK